MIVEVMKTIPYFLMAWVARLFVFRYLKDPAPWWFLSILIEIIIAIMVIFGVH